MRKLSPAAPTGQTEPLESTPSTLLPPPQALTVLLPVGGIGGSQHVGQGGAQGRGHVLGKVVRVGLCGESHWGQPGPVGVGWDGSSRGQSPGVSGGSGRLLTAADGLRPTPDPIALALPLHRPRQHQI